MGGKLGKLGSVFDGFSSSNSSNQTRLLMLGLDNAGTYMHTTCISLSHARIFAKIICFTAMWC